MPLRLALRRGKVGLDAGVTNAYAHLRHLVFSTTLAQSPDPGGELVATDPVETVRQLKAEPSASDRGIWLVGGATLAAALYDEIDEIVLKLNPVTAGTGIPLFAGRSGSRTRSFGLTDHTILESGVAVLTYSAGASTP